MAKSQYISLFFLILWCFFGRLAFGMEVPRLKWVEREIFLATIKQIGIEKTQKKIRKMSEGTPIVIKLKLYPEHKNDVLIKMVYEAVAKKEYKEGYVPKQIETKQAGDCFAPQKNNFLGDYTKYWHKKDDKGKYIKCKTTFTRRDVLEEELKDINLDNFKTDTNSSVRKYIT